MTGPRAADDFDVIRERLEELRREREENAPSDQSGDAPGSEDGEEAAEDDDERRDRIEGLPPPWVPTIFLPQPTD